MERGPRAALDPIPVNVPTFPSYVQLKKVKRLRPAVVRWALDSGGFTVLKDHGRWIYSPEEYAYDVQRYQAEIGCLDFASIQDYMCEPGMIRGGRVTAGPYGIAKGTGLSVEEHQRRTVLSYLKLRELAPGVPWIPILQGFEIRDYYRCMALYMEHGVSLLELQAAPRVGIGSVCRRQNTREVAAMLREFRDGYGLNNLHGFGFKIQGLLYAARFLKSADSFAWSREAFMKRDEPSELGHDHGRKGGCQNCPEYAVRWRNRLMEKILLAYQRVSDAGVDAALRWVNDNVPLQERDFLAPLGEQLDLFS
jgi:hypothetical protein